MARQKGRLLPFRIPFFRIFYSTTYTTLYFIEIVLLAITPGSLIWTSIENPAYQYILMVGSVYVLVALLAIFIYSSRLYTNRTVLAGVGKAYIPVEDGEVGKKVRKMIVKQLERSAIIAWEAKPRDVYGEIYAAEQEGVLPSPTRSINHNDYNVGRIIQIDPARPPWGIVRHKGWSSPSQRDDNLYPGVQFANVVAELPNLMEAKAVGLAPADSLSTPSGEEVIADPAVVEALTRPASMGMRDYVKQLGYLGLINPGEVGETFMRHYEHVRFCGRPATEKEFAELMATFSELLAGMTELDTEIVEQIREQTAKSEDEEEDDSDEESDLHTARSRTYTGSERAYSHSPSAFGEPSPVTAREERSRSGTPYMQKWNGTQESFSSVIHHDRPGTAGSAVREQLNMSSSNLAESERSVEGSVIHYDLDREDG